MHTARVARSACLTFAAVALLLPACTGDDSGPDSGAGGAGEAPSSISAEVDGNRLVVSFEPADGADAHLLRLDGHDDPIRVENDECADGTCSVSLDRLSTGTARQVTVSAVHGDGESEPSDPVDLPTLPAPEPAPADAPTKGPVRLAVTRIDDTGKPVVKTETVDASEVEARITALESAEDVAGVGVVSPLEPLSDDAENPYPTGLGSWQQEAFDFDSLPPEPRGKGVTVAVVDDGVVRNHPALDQADITEINVVEPGRDSPDDHGTLVTSMIVGESPGLVPGIAPAATIRSYDMQNTGGEREGDISDMARAIIQAVDDGADVINVSTAARCGNIESWRDGCAEDVLLPAIEHAETQGVVVVAAAGNDGDGAPYCPGTNLDSWPAAFPTVIAVGGTARDGSVWPCTPDKDYIDVLAPAAYLRVADPGGGYAIASGTSFSAPLVSGLIAAILAEMPDLSPAEIRELLRNATDENGRLIPNALLVTLGLAPSDEPVIDLTTAREVIPFAAQITYPKSSEIYEDAANAYEEAPRFNGTGGFFWDPFTRDTFHLRVGGLLLVDGDNKITGFGHMQPFAGMQSMDRGMVTGHIVECPVGIPTPIFVFDWDVGVLVSGEVVDDEAGTSNRYAKLALSFGVGATADEGGRLPGVQVRHDNFAECGALLEEEWVVVGRGEPPDWAEVKTWPDRNVAAFQPLYGGIVGASPYRAENVFFPPPGGDGSVYQSAETHDGVSYEFRIGSFDTNALFGNM